jgi:type IV secretory pathway VirB3-like protein
MRTRNHQVYASLTRPFVLLGVSFHWLLIEFIVTFMMFIWFKLLLVAPLTLIAMHIWGVFETKKDPNFLKVLAIWLKHFRSTNSKTYNP